MVESKAVRKGGRKANQWTSVAFADIAEYLANSGVSQLEFAKSVGVTSSTFHNWKTQRCAPDETTQERILAVLNGQEASAPKKEEEETVAKKKAPKKVAKKKVTARGSRGAASSLLAVIDGAAPTVSEGKPKKKVKKIVKKAKLAASSPFTGEVAKRKPGRPRKVAVASNGGGALSEWSNLGLLAQFLKDNKGRTAEDVKNVIEQVDEARRVANIFA